MCVQNTTVFKTCGCRVVELYARCAYYEDNLSECMTWTVINEMPDQPGKCLKRNCKNPNAQAPPEIKQDKQEAGDAKVNEKAKGA